MRASFLSIPCSGIAEGVYIHIYTQMPTHHVCICTCMYVDRYTHIRKHINIHIHKKLPVQLRVHDPLYTKSS